MVGGVVTDVCAASSGPFMGPSLEGSLASGLFLVGGRLYSVEGGKGCY